MTAPDQADRGELVEVLRSARCPSCYHRPAYHRLGWCMFQTCDCSLSDAEALAPTVEAYARKVADAAVAERVAGVEALHRPYDCGCDWHPRSATVHQACAECDVHWPCDTAAALHPETPR